MQNQGAPVRRSATGRIPQWAMDEAVRNQRASVPQAPLLPSPSGDLLLTAPGAAARSRAVELTAGHPFRSRLARALGVRRPEHSWQTGARGEELVARELARLGHPWVTLHSVPVGTRGSDIDHVVIGPAGVFTLNSKHHRGARVRVDGDRVWVNRQYQHYVRNSRHEAVRAARMLSAAVGFPVPAQGLVVPVGAATFDVRRQPADVRVVNRARVRRWLGDRQRVWSDDQVAAVVQVARRPGTWVG